MEPETLVTLILNHQWIAFGAILIGFCIRLLKLQRVQLLLHIPARFLPLVALLLGQAQAILEYIVAGQDPVRAIIQGLIAAALAVGAHEALVEGLLGGRELGRTPEVRGLAKASPASAKAGQSASNTVVINVSGAAESVEAIKSVRDALADLQSVTDEIDVEVSQR